MLDFLTCEGELEAVVRPDGVLARRPGGGAARGGAVLLLRRRGLHRRGRRDLVRGDRCGGGEIVCVQGAVAKRDQNIWVCFATLNNLIIDFSKIEQCYSYFFKLR